MSRREQLTNQREEIKNAKKLKIVKQKHTFSESFANILHEFSKKHSTEKLKEFRNSWNEWIQREDIKTKIQQELDMNQEITEEEIIKKIHISARFYYRKKSKRVEKPRNKKIYIRFSTEFIVLIDETIKNLMFSQSQKDNVQLYQPEILRMFTLGHIDEMRNEFRLLKNKYDSSDEKFIPSEIVTKLKKTFNNRYYNIVKILRDQINI